MNDENETPNETKDSIPFDTAHQDAGKGSNPEKAPRGKNGLFCERCGHEIKLEEKYCSVCGMATGVWGSYCSFWKKYADFKGRASRSEFWFAMALVYILEYGFSLLLAPFLSDTAMLVFGLIYQGVMLLPLLALGCRRLHDIGRSGWLQLVAIIPGMVYDWAIGNGSVGWGIIFGGCTAAGMFTLVRWFCQPTNTHATENA